jgi:alkylated DNA repair dioxygenase AlkB
MKTVIQTEKSFLKTDKFTDIDLIKNVVEEIGDKLIHNPKIIVYGRECHQHRSVGFFSETSVGYFYSGQLAKSIPLLPSTKKLLESINSLFGAEFNGILVNKYMDGNDTIGAHSDDEKNLDTIGVVAISWGAIRKFRIRDKPTRKIVKDLLTESGGIIHMGGDFQKEFTHEIPVEKKVKGCRYSFTFRKHLI